MMFVRCNLFDDKPGTPGQECTVGTPGLRTATPWKVRRPKMVL